MPLTRRSFIKTETVSLAALSLGPAVRPGGRAEGAQELRQDVQLLSIAANRNETAQMVEEAARARRLPVVLLDAEHAVADRYEAVTTPHDFVVDREGILRYRGAVDDVTFRQRKATRFYLEEAVEALLDNRVPELQETSSYGCTIVREI